MIEFGNFYQLIAKTIFPTGWKPCLRKLPLAARSAAWSVEAVVQRRGVSA